jgi:hypothetical protein
VSLRRTEHVRRRHVSGASLPLRMPSMPADNISSIVDPGADVPVLAHGEVWTADAVILDRRGEAFAQKRSPDRRLLVQADGDLARPALERSKHTAYGWFGPAGPHLLKENRPAGEWLIHDLIAKAVRDASPR